MNTAFLDSGDWWEQMKNIGSGPTPSEFGGKSKQFQPRCYESHPPLKIGKYVIYGGNCSHPKVKNADVYVATDRNNTLEAKQPWDSQEGAVFTQFTIQDMQAPDDAPRFKKMIEWLAAQLIAGKKCHVGCIGGHGRTGTVLSALVQHMTGEEDAITYVRTAYCKKAVESKAQIEFLHEHFGIKKVAPTKAFASYDKVVPYSTYPTPPKTGGAKASINASPKLEVTGRISPVPSPRSLWGLTTLTTVL